MIEQELSGGSSTSVHRRGDVVLRGARPWSTTILRLLAHLSDCGGVPRSLGFAPDGREQLEFIAGESASICWSAQGTHGVGQLLRRVHDGTEDFDTTGATWMPWWGGDLPSEHVVIGHGDAAPWNFLVRDGLPIALLDWDSAGPMGREWDTAQAAWLNCQLHDDDVAERIGLPDAQTRAGLVSAFCDGYGMAAHERSRLVERMIEVAVRTSAQEAIDGGIGPDGAHPAEIGRLGGGAPMAGHELTWAVTWRVRSARWMLANRTLLQRTVSTAV